METVLKSPIPGDIGGEQPNEIQSLAYTYSLTYRKERTYNETEGDCQGQSVIEYKEETITRNLTGGRGFDIPKIKLRSYLNFRIVGYTSFPRPLDQYGGLTFGVFSPVFNWWIDGGMYGTETRNSAQGFQNCVQENGSWILKLDETTGTTTNNDWGDTYSFILYRKWYNKIWGIMFSHDRMKEEDKNHFDAFSRKDGLTHTYTLDPIPLTPSEITEGWAYTNYEETITISFAT